MNITDQVTYLGRWITDSNGYRYSGWSGAQVRFNISNCTELTVTCYIIKTGTADNAAICYNIDNSAVIFSLLASSSETGSFTRTSANLTPDTGDHNINFKMYNDSHINQLSGTETIRIVSINTNDDAVVTPHIFSSDYKTIAILADSWSGTENDWPRFLPSRYKYYPIAYGGMKASEMATKYPYVVGSTVASDPAFDAVVIEYGVNDANSNVSTSAYKDSVLSIVSQVLSAHPYTIIYLCQVPDSPGTNDYSQYGTVLNEIAVALPGTCVYVPYTGTPVVYWEADNAHLTLASRQVWADFVASAFSFPGTGVLIGVSGTPYVATLQQFATSILLDIYGQPLDLLDIYGQPINIT